MKKINSLEYNTFIWFLIRACFAEFTLSILIHKVKQDSWISVIVGTILGLIPFFIYEYLQEKYPTENIIEINKKLFKHLGKYLNLLLLLITYLTSIYTFWILVHYANSLFLYKTNTWIISLAFIIPIGYASNKKIHIIGKISLILFYISFLLNLLIIIGLFGETDISNIKPIFENSNQILNYGALFIGINISKLFLLNIIPKSKIKNYSKKTNTIFYLLVCINLIFFIFSIISILGINLSILYEYPAFQILKRVNIFGVFDRVENILSIEGILCIFIETIITIYYIKEIIITTLNTKEKTNKYINTFICLTIFFISNIIFVTHEAGELFFTTILLYSSYFAYIFIPIIILIKSLYHSKVIQN